MSAPTRIGVVVVDYLEAAGVTGALLRREHRLSPAA
jgi:hypothetical protein